jgi:putative intracellular protease/amidase
MRLRSLKPMGLMPDFESDIWALTVDIADDKGLRITPTVVSRPLSGYDLIVVSGEIGTRVLQHDKAVIDWGRTSEPVKLKASVCTGSLLLDTAGSSSNDMRATTNRHRSQNLFKFAYDSLACRANSRRGGTHI